MQDSYTVIIIKCAENIKKRFLLHKIITNRLAWVILPKFAELEENEVLADDKLPAVESKVHTKICQIIHQED